ncbi:MAG: hypothetical protein WBV43_07125 [Pseudolabrys sp.]
MGQNSLHFAAIWFSAWGALMTYNRISHEPAHAPGAFHGPDCPQCGELMWRTLIEPDKPDHDRRTFECASCKRVEKVAVKYR